MYRSLRSRCALVLTVLFAIPAALRGQQALPDQPIQRPAAAERIVRTFDFERSPEEIFAIPRYWDLAQDGSAAASSRPGFPRFNSAAFDFTTASRGGGSVRLSAQSGSVSLRLDRGVIPVFPDTDYLVSARVKTSPLRHARAAISARFLDQASKPIASSEHRSSLIAGDSWSLVTVTLPGDTPGVAFLQIDLELLQPQEFQSQVLGRHQVWPQDFPADAWFDEVSIVQLPRVRLVTNSPVGVITAPESPMLSATVRDLTGEAMHMLVTVQDAAGIVVDSRNTSLGAGSDAWEWSPKLPGFGWYRATLELSNGNLRVGSTYTDFVWSPAAARDVSPESRAFAVQLSELPSASGPQLASLLQELGAGQISIPVWHPALSKASAAEHVDQIGKVVDALDPHAEITFTLPLLPEELAGLARLEGHQVADAFSVPEGTWSPYLFPLLDKFGQRVQRWQVGSVDSPPSANAAAIARLRSFLSTLVPGPTLLSPAPAELDAGMSNPRERMLLVSEALSPRAVGELAALHSKDHFARPTLYLRTLPDQYARDQAALDLVQRAVEIWAATRRSVEDPAPRIALQQPWSWATPGRPIMPAPEYAALRTANEQLGGKRLAAVYPAGSSVTAYLFVPADQRSGTLVAWVSGPAESNVLSAYLGAGSITACDIFGNRTPVMPSSDGAGPPVHQIRLSESPLFIENVDPHLCQFTAALEIDPPVIPVTAGEHQVEVRMTNTWPSRIDGRLIILEPGGLSSGSAEERDRSWRIQPRSQPFSAGPGQTVSLPVSMMFSGVEDAGQKRFVVELELNADRAYPPIRISREIELAADRVQLDVAYRPIPDSGDLIIEAQVTNKSTDQMTLELSAIAPGLPRSKASVSDLEPGATATRRFVLQGAARQLRGQTVTVSAQEFQARARITRSLRVD